MNKLYFFIEPTGYNRYIAAAAEGSDVATVFCGFKSKMKEQFLKLYNAWPLNKRAELPFKGYLFKKYLEEIPQDTTYIIMAESFHLSYSRVFLKNLRKRFPHVKICFMFSNPVGKYNIAKARAFRGDYDAFLTFAKDDAERYNFHYCDTLPMRLPDPDDSLNIDTDVFFVGKNKGRLDTIYKIYEKLHSLGLKCKFYIVGVSEENQRNSDEIIYNTPIPYDEVLQHVQQSRCILEVLQEGCNYVSMKTIEAIHYRKKILTNNEYADQCDLYSPDYIRIIKDINSIDLEFIRHELPEVSFSMARLNESYDSMVSYLDKLFGNNE